eukprot:11217578-Lingulodinium_polyedra.AAC.1
MRACSFGQLADTPRAKDPNSGTVTRPATPHPRTGPHAPRTAGTATGPARQHPGSRQRARRLRAGRRSSEPQLPGNASREQVRRAPLYAQLHKS